ncbi:hypothetical protein [Roseateles terrae]|uniref:Uncharacterized protein n=1 Tax=Roseateles terrae TaxID=431060 RepID=A0ABR6GRU2_9BURK|nr:hypothetical protein [Roseateles terrae]MBB3194839.1 hypothetical protein [Roseateles terrae]OWQ85895.1 hypothetical protein CDN98_14350 [Roseateles terrae]
MWHPTGPVWASAAASAAFDNGDDGREAHHETHRDGDRDASHEGSRDGIGSVLSHHRDRIGDPAGAAQALPAAMVALPANLHPMLHELAHWNCSWRALASLHERGRGPLRESIAQWCRQQADHAAYCAMDGDCGLLMEGDRYLRRAPEIQQALNRLWAIRTVATEDLNVFLQNRLALHDALTTVVIRKLALRCSPAIFENFRRLTDCIDACESADTGLMTLNQAASVLRLHAVSADRPVWTADEVLQRLLATFVHRADPAPRRSLLGASIAPPPSSPAHPGSGGLPRPAHR